MRCPECNRQFTAIRSDQGWCSAACNRKAGNRELARARVIYRAAYHWRMTRGKKGFGAEDLSFLCREIDAWVKEDRLSQRPPPPRHRHDADRGHLRKKSLMPPGMGGN
jgi:hypothetical protein